MEKVAKLSELKQQLCVVAKGQDLALFRVGEQIHCIDNTCPHAEGPLCEGELDQFMLTCPWHGSQFDVRDGSVHGPPARVGVKSYKVTVQGDEIWVDL